MKRDEILKRGIAVTMGDRDKTYGDPSINMQCAAELKAVYDKYAGWDEGLGHRHAMHEGLAKVARIATGKGVFVEDTYVDAPVYFAIAGEIHPCNPAHQRRNSPFEDVLKAGVTTVAKHGVISQEEIAKLNSTSSVSAVVKDAEVVASRDSIYPHCCSNCTFSSSIRNKTCSGNIRVPPDLFSVNECAKFTLRDELAAHAG